MTSKTSYPICLYRYGGENWPIVSWVLLLALFGDWSYTGFPPVLKNWLCSPWPFKTDGAWLTHNICHLTQYSWVHPFKTHGFLSVQLVYVISNPVLLDKLRVLLPPDFLSYLQGLGFLKAGLRCEDWRKDILTLLSLCPLSSGYPLHSAASPNIMHINWWGRKPTCLNDK